MNMPYIVYLQFVPNGNVYTFQATGTINLDRSAGALGLVKGVTYPLEIFQAERHSPDSTFRIDTDIAFTNCGAIPPDVPK